MDTPECKGPDTPTILAALAHAGLKHTRPREVITAYVAQKGEENADFTIEDLWHKVRAIQADIARVTGKTRQRHGKTRDCSWREGRRKA